MSRTITMEIYKINELSKEAKERAFSDYCSEGDYSFSDDNEATLEAFEKIFPVNVRDWSYGGYRDHVNFCMTTEYDEIDEFSGIRLMKYLWNNYGEYLFKGRYYSTGGYRDANGKYCYKYRHSKIILDNSCVLTGYYMDCEILEPIYEFLKNPSKNITFNDLMQKCLDNWIKACTKDYEYYFSMESFVETSEANDWEYYEDGSLA